MNLGTHPLPTLCPPAALGKAARRNTKVHVTDLSGNGAGIGQVSQSTVAQIVTRDTRTASGRHTKGPGLDRESLVEGGSWPRRALRTPCANGKLHIYASI
jgi:hypothetical protein